MNKKSRIKSPKVILTALLIFALVMGVFAVVRYQKLVVAPKQKLVIDRYEQFLGIVASGDEERILEMVAPKSRAWAQKRLHLYQNFAIPLDNRSTVYVSDHLAMICPRPQRHFYIIPGGHTVGMVKSDGEWFVDRVSID